MTGLLTGMLVAAAVTGGAPRDSHESPSVLVAAGSDRIQARPVGQAPARGPRAGEPPRGRRGNDPPPAPTSADAEALFERFVLRQARAALRLTPAEMRRLEPRIRDLQITRRRAQRERARLLNGLAAATRGGSPVDETLVREQLEAIEQHRVSAESQVREALAKIDEMLTVEQRARFRVFERRIERQKFELLARARREADASRRQPGPVAPPAP